MVDYQVFRSRSDGSISLNKANGQLSISLSQKTSEILQPLIDI